MLVKTQLGLKNHSLFKIPFNFLSSSLYWKCCLAPVWTHNSSLYEGIPLFRPVDRNKNALHLSSQDFSSLPFIVQSEKKFGLSNQAEKISLSSSQSETRSTVYDRPEGRSLGSAQSESRFSHSSNQSDSIYSSLHQSQNSDWSQQRNYTSLIIRNFGNEHSYKLDDSNGHYKSLSVDEPRIVADDSSIKSPHLSPGSDYASLSSGQR